MALTGTNFIAGGTTVNVSGTGVTVIGRRGERSSTSLGHGEAQHLAGGEFREHQHPDDRQFRDRRGRRPRRPERHRDDRGWDQQPLSFTVSAPPPGAPTLTSVSPNQGIQGATVAVTLTGTNFVVGATTVTVAGGGVTVNNVVVGSSTSLTANFVLDRGRRPRCPERHRDDRGRDQRSANLHGQCAGAGGADADERLAESRHPGRHGRGRR